MMSERERMLNSSASFLVAVTRIAEHATLVTDNPERVERQVAERTGEKASAMEIVKDGTEDPVKLPAHLEKLASRHGPEFRAMLVEDQKNIQQASARGSGRDAPDLEQSHDFGR